MNTLTISIVDPKGRTRELRLGGSIVTLYAQYGEREVRVLPDSLGFKLQSGRLIEALLEGPFLALDIDDEGTWRIHVAGPGEGRIEVKEHEFGTVELRLVEGTGTPAPATP